MTGGDPTQHVFWLASRALGIVAIALLAVSVSLGLAMSGRLTRRPGLPATVRRLHEASTLVTLGLIVAHAGVLLGDGYLRPGLAGVALPFQLGYRPLWSGTGILAGWLAAILGLSFYARRRIGIRTWRWLHRWTLAVYVLAIVHAIGAGTDGHSTWMLAMLTLLTTPILFALTCRVLPRRPPRPRARQPSHAGRPPPRHNRRSTTPGGAPPAAAHAGGTAGRPSSAWRAGAVKQHGHVPGLASSR